MKARRRSHAKGFVLMEALIALLLIGIGLLAVSRLQTLGLSSSGESKARTEAAHLAQKKLEELRNIMLKAGFTALANGNTSVTGNNATYALAWTVTSPDTLEQRRIQITTTWTDQRGLTQRLDMNSLIAWDDPGLQAKAGVNNEGLLITPTGDAERATETFDPLTGTANPDGTYLHTEDDVTYLLKANGEALLKLKPKGDPPVAQAFTTISGWVVFDSSVASGQLPSAANVRVRLSSEGECIYDEDSVRVANMGTTSPSGHKYFKYTCYVGPGWYGNIGVTVDDSVSGAAAGPTICVGDPAFNGGVAISTVVSPHPREAAVRTYRGFRLVSGVYLSTGMAGGRQYGLPYDGTTALISAPYDGTPRPNDYHPAYYSANVINALNYYNQNFLVTRLTGSSSCASKMAGGDFPHNAGKYVCISPDVHPATDACPDVWPGFEGEVGGGGAINYGVDVSVGGNGSGTVSSAPAGIDCGTGCSASWASGSLVTLTATAAAGSTFVSWSGCPSNSVTNTCTFSLTTGTPIIAIFDLASAGNVPLSVAKAGAGSGTVTGVPAGIPAAIDCGATCTADFAIGTLVTLTATPDGTSTFAGWSGACTGIGSCVVTMDAAKLVTATFTSAVNSQTLTVTRAGTGAGSVSSSPAGIDCGTTCTATYSTGTAVTLTAVATAGSAFGSWSGCDSVAGNVCGVTMDAAKSVTASFTANAVCTTPVSGTAVDKNGTVDVSPSGYGTCAMAGGNSNVYSCSLSAPSGTVVTLTNSRTTGNPQYSYSKSVTADCVAKTNVSFP